MTPSRALLNSINKLKECFAATTAALAPYPVTGVQGKKRTWHIVKHNENCYTVECNDGSLIKQFFKTQESAQKVCDKYNEVK